jgi:hypothetical protein
MDVGEELAEHRQGGRYTTAGEVARDTNYITTRIPRGGRDGYPGGSLRPLRTATITLSRRITVPPRIPDAPAA